MVFLLIFTVTVLPVSITFFGADVDYKWLGVNTVVDVLFLSDIVINFRTGVVSADAAPDHVNCAFVMKEMSYCYLCLFYR